MMVPGTPLCGDKGVAVLLVDLGVCFKEIQP